MQQPGDILRCAVAVAEGLFVDGERNVVIGCSGHCGFLPAGEPLRNAAAPDQAVSLWYSCFIYVLSYMFPQFPFSSLPLSFVILPKGWHFHESDGNAGSTGIIHARTDTILSYVYFTGNGRI